MIHCWPCKVSKTQEEIEGGLTLKENNYKIQKQPSRHHRVKRRDKVSLKKRKIPNGNLKAFPPNSLTTKEELSPINLIHESEQANVSVGDTVIHSGQVFGNYFLKLAVTALSPFESMMSTWLLLNFIVVFFQRQTLFNFFKNNFHEKAVNVITVFSFFTFLPQIFKIYPVSLKKLLRFGIFWLSFQAAIH